MKLEALFQTIPIFETIHWDPHRKIQKITSDSRAVETGDMFVACSGSRMDGHDFLGEAIHAGASAVVFERTPDFPIPRHVTAIRVAHSRDCFALLLKRYYDSPDQRVKLIGVTGTNGKTTIAYLLYRLLGEKVKTGYVGTLGYEWAGKKIGAPNTTPGSETLFPLLHQMHEDNVRYCFMEVSSHSLSQRRVHGLQFETVVFTQLTQDHLDYHRTLERYYQAKRILFSAEPLPHQMLINKDCPYGRRLLDENLEAKSFSIVDHADYQAMDIVSSLQGSHFILKYGKHKNPFKIRLPMRHNVSNIVAILGVLEILGFDPAEFRGALQELAGVPGRLERIVGSEDFDVFVDYAHTPDAFEHVLGEARQLKPKRILTLFGCGGDRDREKRPIMTASAVRYSDLVILTSDNPRSEDPESILEDMKKGISSAGNEHCEILENLDRRAAIEKMISLAGPGDVLFLLGKGHEDYQILGDTKVPFDDRQVVRECLQRKSRVFLS